MPFEAVGLGDEQTGAVFVDRRREAVNGLHEHFDVWCRTTSTQRNGRTRRLVAGAVVALSKPLQHGKIERCRFAWGEHTIDVDDNQPQHRL